MRKLALVMVVAGTGLALAAMAAAQEPGQPASKPAAGPAVVAASEPASVPATTQAVSEEEQLKATAQKRTAAILETLALTDKAVEAKVRDILVAYHVKRIGWGANDDKIKDLEKQLAKAKGDKDDKKVKELEEQIAGLKDELTDMCETFLVDLGKLLSAEQIDTVKDVMTYGRAKIIYNKIVADNALTDAQKAAVAKILADARDQAWKAGSSGDKHKIFDNKAVGRVNNYVDALKKLEAAQAAIQAGRLDEAEELLKKIEGRDWLTEALGRPLVDARQALDAAKAKP